MMCVLCVYVSVPLNQLYPPVSPLQLLILFCCITYVCLSTCLTTTNTNLFCCCIKHLSSPFLNNFNYFFSRKIGEKRMMGRSSKCVGEKRIMGRSSKCVGICLKFTATLYGGTMVVLLTSCYVLVKNCVLQLTIQISTVLTT